MDHKGVDLDRRREGTPGPPLRNAMMCVLPFESYHLVGDITAAWGVETCDAVPIARVLETHSQK